METIPMFWTDDIHVVEEAQVVSANNNHVGQLYDEQSKTTAHIPTFPHLSEDLQMFILSFVAEVPFEGDPHKPSPVTHIWPLVCKSFHGMCQSNYFWQKSLERLVQKEPFLWKNGLLKVCPTTVDADDVVVSPDFVRRVHEALDEPGYLQMFRMIVKQYLRLVRPVFMRPDVIRLDEPIDLYICEPRYRFLIRQVMDDFPDDAREGGPITPQGGCYPTFVYSHMKPFAPPSPACLVEVHQCTIYDNGTADVMIVPKFYVRMELSWEQPDTGRLHFAQCLRLGLDDSNQVEALNLEPDFDEYPPDDPFANPLIQMLLYNTDIGGDRAMMAYLYKNVMDTYELPQGYI